MVDGSFEVSGADVQGEMEMPGHLWMDLRRVCT